MEMVNEGYSFTSVKHLTGEKYKTNGLFEETLPRSGTRFMVFGKIKRTVLSVCKN
jgi:hypothetical protein